MMQNRPDSLTLYDIFLLQPFLEDISKEARIQIQKRIGSKTTKYPQELRIGVRLFGEFFNMLVVDLMTKPIYFRYSKLKTIKLFRQEHTPIIKQTCRYLGVLPSMPVYNIVLQDYFKGKVRKKHFILYNELKEMLQTKTKESDLCTNSTIQVGVHTYVPIFKKIYPELPEQIIRKILNHGIKYLFLPLQNKQIRMSISLYNPIQYKLQMLSSETPGTVSFKKSAMVRYGKHYRHECFYALLSDRQKELLDSGAESIRTHHIFSMDLVKLFVRKKYKRYKHVYKIKDTHWRSHRFSIFINDVQASSLEYVYRRVNFRFKPVDVPEQHIN